MKSPLKPTTPTLCFKMLRMAARHEGIDPYNTLDTVDYAIQSAEMVNDTQVLSRDNAGNWFDRIQS